MGYVHCERVHSSPNGEVPPALRQGTLLPKQAPPNVNCPDQHPHGGSVGPVSVPSCDPALVLYDFCHDTDRAAIHPSRGSWRITVRYAHVASLEAALLEAGADHFGLKPLSDFAPYRLGASARADVIAERAAGLRKFLQHVLKVTEAPAPPSLTRLLDDFVTKQWRGERGEASAGGAYAGGGPRHSLPKGMEQDAAVVTFNFGETYRGCGKLLSMASARGATSRSKRPAGFRAFLRKVDEQGALDSTSSAKPSSDSTDANAADALPKVWRHAMAPMCNSHAKPFLQQIRAEEAGNSLCHLCFYHLRSAAKNCGSKNCVRLKTCGHEVHSECFNDLLRGGTFRNKYRSVCPTCNECWAEWGLDEVQRYELPAGLPMVAKKAA